MNTRISPTERRFREGSGVRYMADGSTVRCQAVSKSKMKAIQEEKQNFKLTSDDVWPQAQCEHPAVPGKLVCGGRGGHGGGSETVPTYDPVDFMPVDMAEMMREVMKNPHLLSRRFELQQLVSRIFVLYQRIAENEAAGSFSLDDIRAGVGKIKAGNVEVGIEQIEASLDYRKNEQQTYKEIFETMALLKDMTRTEMTTLKEMQQIITIEQMMAFVKGQAVSLLEALEAYIPDEFTRRRIIEHVDQSTTRRLNTRLGTVLAESPRLVEGSATET